MIIKKIFFFIVNIYKVTLFQLIGHSFLIIIKCNLPIDNTESRKIKTEFGEKLKLKLHY